MARQVRMDSPPHVRGVCVCELSSPRAIIDYRIDFENYDFKRGTLKMVDIRPNRPISHFRPGRAVAFHRID